MAARVHLHRRLQAVKLIHDKLPALVALDFKAGSAHRYLRRFDTSGAGLSWQTICVHKATFEADKTLPAETVEKFRATGVV